MRRIISISLLLLFTLALVSPLFAASTAEANVPVCCRRNGKHHCVMTAAIAQRSSSDDSKTKAAASLHGRCPYNLASSVTVNLPFTPDKAQPTIFAGTVSNSEHAAQAEIRIYISLNRSHQKRGPPFLILSHS